MAIQVTSRGERESSMGLVEQLKVHSDDYRNLSWREVRDAFAAARPGRWAVQLFPPDGQVLDAKPVYHLFVLPAEPVGLNLRA